MSQPTVYDAIESWAHDRNLIDGSNSRAQLIKLGEEFGELCAALARDNATDILDAIGDMVVVLTIIAAQQESSLSTCAQLAYDEIKHRKGRMVDGIFVKEE